MVAGNIVRLSRIYPKGQRIDSSNYSPFSSWCKGCQMIALNWQTKDGPPFSLYEGLFSSNGGGGYVVKPPFLLGEEKSPHQSLTLNIYFVMVEGLSTALPFELTIRLFSLTNSIIQQTSPMNSKGSSEDMLFGIPHLLFLESRTFQQTTPFDLIQFKIKYGKGDKKMNFYGSGQIRCVAPGFFILPLLNEKGLHVETKARLVGEVKF